MLQPQGGYMSDNDDDKDAPPILPFSRADVKGAKEISEKIRRANPQGPADLAQQISLLMSKSRHAREANLRVVRDEGDNTPSR